MKITILGTGSPEGHPVLLHPSEFTLDGESRLRPGLLLQDEDLVILDVNPDIRQQLLHLKVKKINSIFITHPHFDHLWGIGDIAQLNWLGEAKFKVYVNQSTKNYIDQFIPWTNLNYELFTYDKEYKFNNFAIIPRKAMHSEKFETAVFEIVSNKSGHKALYAPDFKGFSSYEGDIYEFAVIDGVYYFGKYINDNDHLGGQELVTLIRSISAKKHYLISISPYWYKKTSEQLAKEFPEGLAFPEDYQTFDL